MSRPAPAPLAVLVSGGGSNLQALLDRFGHEGWPDAAAAVRLVISDRPEIPALARAERAGVPTIVVEPDADANAFAGAVLDALRAHAVELVILAGYVRLVPPQVVAAFRGRMLNIHPGPLPAFGGPGLYGRRVHEAVLAAGIKISGPTVHFVDERYDAGPIVAQWPVPVLAGDTAETLAARVLHAEHRLLPAVTAALARGRVALDEDGRVRGPLDLRSGELGFALAEQSLALSSIDHAYSDTE